MKYFFKKNNSFLFFISMLLCGSCTQKKEIMLYKVNKLSGTLEINGEWNKHPWNKIEALELKYYMGEKPAHFPDTKAKIAYDDLAVYVIFKVDDQYVIAKYDQDQDPVYKDSCVEFFFIPSGKIENGYFNLEMNCGGTLLFHHQLKPRTGSVSISPDHISQINVATSLPKIVEPEIDTKTTWVVEYRIPFSILKEYHDFIEPASGSKWRVNFYKCADESSFPHWLTWAPVEHPAPNFHLPEYFGWLEF